jgi:hypothetical protein
MSQTEVTVPTGGARTGRQHLDGLGRRALVEQFLHD